MECLHCRCSSKRPAVDFQNLKFRNRPQQLAAIENGDSPENSDNADIENSDSAETRRRKAEKRRRKAENRRKSEHKLTLLDWNTQLAASSNNLVRKLSSRNSSTSDLYQILGLFFVFEGVVITAVAQATAIKCRNSWLIFTLSTISSLATLFACIQKLREIGEADKVYMEEKALCSSLFNSIERLKEEGTSFDLVEGQPTLRHTYTDRGDQSSDSPEFSVRVRSFFKTWVWSYAGAVFLVLLSFSGVTLAAVRLIVCDPKRNT